jgi:aryl-alcohol dehydrogenase-like predicted oxidoreductase
VETRNLGRTGRAVSVVGLGCWQIGSGWGTVGDRQALDVLQAAVEHGITFFDTADVYGDGRSEQLIGRFLRERPDAPVTVATKMGRRATPHVAEAYTPQAFRDWTDRSRANLGTDRLDLVQLHCPPSEVISRDAVYDALDALVGSGAVAAYGVSVETCQEALEAIERPGVATVQIVLNAFRHKPLEQVLPAARAAGVGIIARVPLASGLLSGRYDESTVFASDDHRTFNRTGEAFDVGETFSGVPFDVGLAAVRELRELPGEGVSSARFALRWVLDQSGTSVVIPGARTTEQVEGNAAAAGLPPLSRTQLEQVRSVYDRRIRPLVHDRW